MQVSTSRYSAVAVVLHWAIAALILLNLYLGFSYGFAVGLEKFSIIQLHKSVGFTVLALSLARLAWRLAHRPPPYPAAMKGWEKAGAHAVHWALYGIMLGQPLTGWVLVSASPTNIPTLLYKTVRFPHIGPIHDMAMGARRALTETVGDVHEFLAWTTVALLALHVGAALKHHLWDRDDVLTRMVPFLASMRKQGSVL